MSQPKFKGAVPILGSAQAAAQDQLEKLQARITETCLDDPKPGSTHVLIRIPSQDREDLYRADGMLIASRSQDRVTFGVEAKEPGNRLFLNPACAARWIRKLAGMELVTRTERLTLAEAIEQDALRPTDIEERNAESMLTLMGDYRN